MVDLASVMGNTVLVRTERLASRWDVCRRDNVKKVLIGNERFVSEFERIVQWLGDVWEVWAKGKFSDDV